MSGSGSRESELPQRRIYERELFYGEAVETVMALMHEHGITQRQLAGRLGVSEARVSRILRGRENLTLNTIADLGWVLGIRFAFLPVPFDSREGTPAEGDEAAPDWIGAIRRQVPTEASGP